MSSKRGKRLKRLGFLVVLGVAGKLVYNWMSMIDSSAIQNNNGNKVQIIGHGGVGVQSIFPFQQYPCNSASSIREAMQSDVAGVELDLQVTADSVLVLYHDNFLQDATALNGCIGDVEWSYISGQNFKLGFPFDWFQDEPILSFQQGLEILREREDFPVVYIDFHAIDYCGEDAFSKLSLFARTLDRFLIENDVPVDKIFVIATHEVALHEFAKMQSKVRLVFEETVDMEAGIEKVKKLGLKHIQAKYPILTKENVKKAHDAGLFVITHRGKTRWGIKKRVELNVDAVQTDAIHTMIDMLAE